MTEFVFNTCISASTDFSSFLANYEFESRMSFDSNVNIINSKDSTRKRLLKEKVIEISEKMKTIWKFARDNNKSIKELKEIRRQE